MARKPPNVYKYAVGTDVSIHCLSGFELKKGVGDLFMLYGKASIFAAMKGFGNTGAFLVDNRESATKFGTGRIVDRANNTYIVQYDKAGDLVMCWESEIYPIELYDDAVVRWLNAKS